MLAWLGATAGLSAQTTPQPPAPLPAQAPLPPGPGDAGPAARRDVSSAGPAAMPEPALESVPDTLAEATPESGPASGPVSAANATARLAPVEQLARMATALASTEFEGTLVYLHGVQLAALRVTHRLEHGESRESLFALSGPIRALTRNGRGVTCVLPNARPIQVRRGAGSMLRSPAPDAARLSEHYLIEALGQSRVAGRDTDVIGIIPRDNLRYGYRYFIDRATGLPLKTDLMDNGATPIEQVMFTEIELILPSSPARAPVDASTRPSEHPPANPPANPRPTTNSLGSPPAADSPAASVVPSRWRFDRLPPGFEVVGQGAAAAVSPSPDAEFFLLSDGLASVSVTIETDTERGFNGTRQFGAAHATGTVRDGHQITAVGEVPAATLQAILDGLARH